MVSNRWIVVWGFILSTGLLSACSDANQTAEERERQLEEYAKSHGVDIDVKVNPDGSTTQLSINQELGSMGSVVGTRLDLPENFPDDVAIYPELKIISVSNLPIGRMVQGQTTDSMIQVTDFYRREMAAKGWIEQNQGAQSPVMQSFNFSKNNRSVGISVIPSGATVTVQIAILQAG